MSVLNDIAPTLSQSILTKYPNLNTSAKLFEKPQSEEMPATRVYLGLGTLGKCTIAC